MSKNSRKAILLLSGGLDSATSLAIAKQDGFEIYAISFLYGQRHSIELECARKLAACFSVNEHREVEIDLGSLGGSSLTTDNKIPKHNSVAELGEEIPSTYVPARNTIFRSYAIAWAVVIGAFDIFIGVNALDYSGYPDCRPEYILAFEKMANLATASGVGGNHLKIHTPLINLTKIGLGGYQGSGKQYFSWIHEDDLIAAIDFIDNHRDIQGAVNIASPYPETNNKLMYLLRKSLKVPFGIPMPKFLLEFGALIIHTETELILKSRNVIPGILLANGFEFRYPKLDQALDQLI